MKRVLICCHHHGISGAQKCVQLLLETEFRSQYNITITVPDRGDAYNWLKARNFDVLVAPVRWWIMPPATFLRDLRIFKHNLRRRVQFYQSIIKTRHIDIVISNTSVLVEPALAAALSGVKHAWHILEVVEKDPDLRTFCSASLYKGVVDDLSDVVITVSNIVREHLISSVSPTKCITVHTGYSKQIDGSAEVVSERSRFIRVLFLGALSERKGIVELAKAALLLPLDLPYEIIVAGADAGKEGEAKRLVADLTADGRFKFLGFRKDAASLLQSADIVVMPSLIDPLPVSVMEAMNAKKAIVATRSGGCEDLLVHGESGLLVPVRDPTALASAIEVYARDPKLRLEHGAQAQRRLWREFTPSRYFCGFARAVDFGLSQQIPTSRRSNAERFLTEQHKDTIRGGLEQILVRTKDWLLDRAPRIAKP